MLRALALARFGSGTTKPNPMVGAIVVKDLETVGVGWHKKCGEDHAEVIALNIAAEKAKGATLYVTLEPCAHQGKTPPCVDAIIKAGISRVVYAMQDPNPNVKGSGGKILKEAGIEVERGVLRREASDLNFAWRHWIKTGKPFVLLKMAVSNDGKIAACLGEQTPITSSVSLAQVHRLRRQFDAILVGRGTIEIDNPKLTNRSGCR